ncbi:TraE/TraK family type IV conjugative transfer system protein [Rhodanobacter denitrificans]|uniref:TraE/TraK family type IV conjugative transfer system protein n=1 Tax=Rhodanobacter denitrificans TaxID=666685 RepID=UPI001F2F05EE|nr:TraE/TraK family type IV conjugative transfer system protein [Rhodanobacter denitrificans]UJJ60579.1 hypothetical protein LRK55_19285 [Rhodanobacter denitrificans]
MKLSTYLASWDATRLENRFGRYVMVLLSATTLLLTAFVMNKDPIIVEIPPGLTDKGTVMVDDASDAVKESWAMYFADQLGNVTPRTADFVDKKLARHLSTSISTQVRQLIATQAKEVKDEQVTIQFSPTDVFSLPDNTVVVTGEYTIRGVRQDERRFVQTFEFGIRVRNYLVVMTSLDAYEGPWRPLEERQKRAAAIAAREKKQ